MANENQHRNDESLSGHGSCCDTCPLKGRQFVGGYGPPPGGPDGATHVIVGEAPGAVEAHQGKPFVGRSGQLLRHALHSVGIDPDTCYMLNVVACHPPGNKLPPEAIECCRDVLKAALKPYIKITKAGKERKLPILVVGAKALQALTGFSTIGKARGHWYQKGRVLATWHPAGVLRQPSRIHEFLMDGRKFAHKGPCVIEEVSYTVVGSIDENDGTVTLTPDRAVDLILEGCAAQRPVGGGVRAVVGFDLETDQTKWWEHEILCMGFSVSRTEAVVFPRELCYTKETQQALIRLFDADVDFLAHNGKFDVRFLIHQLGIINARIDQDSLIAHYTINENMRHGLKELLFNYFGIGDYEGQLVQQYLKSKKDFYSKVPPESLMYYNALDVCYMLQLWDELEKELRNEGLYVQPYKYPMMAAQMPILRMELKGIPVDTEAFQQISKDLGHEKEKLRLDLCQMCGQDLNPGSWQQVKPIMYDYYGMPQVSGYKYNRGSTNAKARTAILQKIDPESEAAQWLRLLGKYKSISKLKSTYVDGLFAFVDKHGHVHPDGLVYGTEHGRLSYRTPPIQSYPKPGTNKPGEKDWGALIRGAFYAPPGWVVLQADYSQAELRTAAGLSGDSFLIDVYKRDGDLHSEVAAALYGPGFTKRHRQVCKYFNFAFLYGGTEKSFVADVGMPMEEAREFVRQHSRSMPQLVAWRDAQFQLMRSQGYVTTITNRRRRFLLITRANKNEARKSSTNAPVAGTASDLTLMSLIEIDKWLRETGLNDQAYIIINVHDSIVLLVRKDIVHAVAVKSKQIMESMGGKWFPMLPWKADIEVGPSWGALHAYDWKGGDRNE